MRYALYARKSHDDTKITEKSLNDQVAVLHEVAQERGYTIVKEYKESKSAKDPGVRPLYSDMIRRIKRGEMDAILTWHINRLSRNMDEGGTLADLLIRGTIKEIRTPSESFKSGDNILSLVLQAATATQNNLDHAAAVQRGITSRIQEGGWTHCAPIGYLNRRDPLNLKKGILEKDPERFETIQQAWRMLLTGAYSVNQVIETMNKDWNFQTRQTANRGGGNLARSHGYKMFSNIFYAGYIQHKGEIRKGTHEPMISVHEFNEAQRIIRQSSKPHRQKREFAYSGLIRCGYCGQQVTAEYHFKSGKHRIYYRCSDSFKQCLKQGINEAELENQVIQLLNSITIDPQLCALAVENIARWQGEQSQSAANVYQQLHRSLESVESQLNNLLSLRLKEIIGDDQLYQSKEAELIAERNRLRLAIQEAEEELEHIRRKAKNGYDFCAFARDHFMLADTKIKRELARSLSIEYVLYAHEVHIEVDPLLVEMGKFVDEMIVKFEPSLKGSQSQYRASFSSRKSFGRGEKNSFEPSSQLLTLLKESHFPNLNLSSQAKL